MKFKPVAPLMIEHRLIERMIAVIKKSLPAMRESQTVAPTFIDTAVDFIRMYADRTHHGKEEDILFRDLALKDIAPEHAQIMQELVEEHKWARATTGQVVSAKNRYINGDTGVVDEIADLLQQLTEFYPVHIAKEDQHFFVPVMKYFSEEELEAMLQEMWEFDRQLIHEKYKKVVEGFEEA